MGTRTVQDELDKKFSIFIEHLPSRQSVSFSAYLDNFKDNYKQEWTSEAVYGRMDPLYFYKNTIRSISLSFYVPSDSTLEAQTNFKKLSRMIRFSYPVYEEPVDLAAAPPPAGGTQASDEQARIKVAGQLASTRTSANNNAQLLSSPPLIGIRFANLISSPNNGGKLIGKFNEIDFTADKDTTYTSVGTNLYPMVYRVQLQFDVMHSIPLGWNKSGTRIVPRDGSKYPYGV